MKMQNRFFVSIIITAALLSGWSNEARAGEELYNGIVLPDQWPPEKEHFSLQPMPVPYLSNPPEVINIDVGRQLFVDDFLIEHSTLTRSYHLAKYYSGNPVLKPDKPWEEKARAVAFSGGTWYDPQDKLFKMWYRGDKESGESPHAFVAYATSTDGINWNKPSLDVEKGTNIVYRADHDTCVVWLDLEHTNPERRFKMVLTPYLRDIHKSVSGMYLYFSPDGIHWEKSGAGPGLCLDRSTFFYNPFRSVWVFSIKWNQYACDIGWDGVLRVKKERGENWWSPGARCRGYREHGDIEEGLQWKPALDPKKASDRDFLNNFLEDAAVRWTGADFLDPMRNPSAKTKGSIANLYDQPELYNLDAVAYESVLLGLFSIFHGDDDSTEDSHRHMTDVTLGYSRDGFHWHRPDRRAFLSVGDERSDWNWTIVQSVGGCCLVVKDKLYFYATGRNSKQDTTGLATLRRDGFASMNACDKTGLLVTRPVKFSGRHLFVNVNTEAGKLEVELLNEGGRVIEPFGRKNCVPVSVDKTLQAVKWKDAEDLSDHAGKTVRFRFYLTGGSLYSFWVSPNESGASEGYVAAGGPGFTGPKDTVGSAVYK